VSFPPPSPAGRSKIPEFAALPPQISQRLIAEGITSLADWRALGPQRLAIFGVTRAVAKLIDKAAAALEQGAS
jgi:hypothetical protein